MADNVFHHIGLTCNDPIMIEKFYTRHFGFKRVRVYAPGSDQVVIIKYGNLAIELFKAKEKNPAKPPEGSGYEFQGLRHVCFLVNDLDKRLKALGSDVKITLGPVDMSGLIPGMKVAWVADPEGNIIELNQGYCDE